MDSMKVISTTTVQAPIDNNNLNSSNYHKINLTPWDLRFLPLETIQKGLLFHQQPIPSTSNQNQINHLKQTLSTTLSYFPPLTGRLIITQHNVTTNNNNNTSCSILCNNLGALFVHAKAENTTVSNILEPNYVPSIVHSFFPLNGVKNHEATSQPILAVQVTELANGIFIGFTVNHVVSDGKSFWHFVNTWSQISKNSHEVTKLPSFKQTEAKSRKPPQNLPERIFHFTKEKIAELKSKATEETKTENVQIKISSLQVLLSHVWRCVVRSKKLDPQEDFCYILSIGVRPRMIPPLEEDYFGNASMIGGVTMKAGEILECGIGKVALELNKMIMSHSDEKIRDYYECWLRMPKIFGIDVLTGGNTLGTSSSPRFDVYGNDFGWGKPVGVRCGGANKNNGKITVFAGVEEGSIDVEVCLSYEILEALGNDAEFLVPSSK
ncbi:putative shikimate O-hydroxycinnamoyltransferase [Medicago truncatula]|nr:putative shikimate O-hydroxycinnamoyltransferase [Medicago truncatula]